jgi:hypothetical protein
MAFWETTLPDLLDAVYYPGWQELQIEQVLIALGKVIAETRESTPDGDIDDDTLCYIESLVGTAFVVSQTAIAQTVAAVKKLSKHCTKAHNVQLSSPQEKSKLLALDTQTVPGTTFKKIELVDAFANYFKHGDEWKGSWVNAQRFEKENGKQSAGTLAKIQALGAEQFSNGNCRRAAQLLGAPSLSDLDYFARIILDWRQEVRAVYEAELHSKGLL